MQHNIISLSLELGRIRIESHFNKGTERNKEIIRIKQELNRVGKTGTHPWQYPPPHLNKAHPHKQTPWWSWSCGIDWRARQNRRNIEADGPGDISSLEAQGGVAGLRDQCRDGGSADWGDDGGVRTIGKEKAGEAKGVESRDTARDPEVPGGGRPMPDRGRFRWTREPGGVPGLADHSGFEGPQSRGPGAQP